MPVLFITMLVGWGGRVGKKLVKAANKWIGTLAATMSFGVLTGPVFSSPSFLILVAGMPCTLFDVAYIWMLAGVRAAERSPEERSAIW